MTTPPGEPPPLSRRDLHRHEARVSARLQEVGGRLVLHDGRVAAVMERVQRTEQRIDVVAVHTDSRLHQVERRADEIVDRMDRLDGRLDDWNEDLLAGVDDHRRHIRTMTVLMALAVVLNVVLVVGVALFFEG